MKRSVLFWVLGLPTAVGIVVWLAGFELGLPGLLLRAWAIAVLTLLTVTLLVRGLRRLLWRVSRRLAFSYVLIGLVPIPLVLLMIAVAGYILSGFFLSHLYRDALGSVANELRFAADHQLDQILRGQLPRSRSALPLAFAYYRQGKKFAGPPTAPDTWQTWWTSETTTGATTLLVAGEHGAPTLISALAKERHGVLVTFTGDLARELADRSGVWVELFRADEAESAQIWTIKINNRELPWRRKPSEANHDELKAFFHPNAEEPEWLDRPSLMWAEISQPFLDLRNGANASRYVSATLIATPKALAARLLDHSSNVEIGAYLVFIVLAFLLFDIYIVAVMMALSMSHGLSRAVNQLTTTTTKMQSGDFSARIQVRRRDQIGALQNSFNRMAANMEELIQQAAQKEILEKELAIARDVQQSLLPQSFSAPAGLTFATFFEPSAAIGGDYYDILPGSDGRVSLVIADVSGHGLSAGLRMAMVKSALQLLCERETDPCSILRQLHDLLRANRQPGFVTATLATFDLDRGELTLTNAGHPPTYHLRRGEVSEITLPSTPLGVFEGRFGHRVLALEPGDILVWISDGLIEATNAEGESFGYEQVATALRAFDGAVDEIPQRLLAAMVEHTGGRPVDDDLTLVAVGFEPDRDKLDQGQLDQDPPAMTPDDDASKTSSSGSSK